VSERLFEKAEMVRLSGVPVNNLPTLAARGMIHTAQPVTRGQRPRYRADEVLKIGLMERLREVGVPYATSARYIDELRERDRRRARSRQQPAAAAGGDAPPAHVPGFWQVLQTRIEADHAVWLIVVDGQPRDMWAWLRPPGGKGEAEFGQAAALLRLSADGFRHVMILSVGDLVRRIAAAARE
jgi:DNA-binding transcriptional MerR regulator